MHGTPRRGKARHWLHVGGPMLLTLSLTACGIEPYRNPDLREEGPARGLFTGPRGEWVIYRKIDTESEGFGSDQDPKAAESEYVNSRSKE